MNEIIPLLESLLAEVRRIGLKQPAAEAISAPTPKDNAFEKWDMGLSVVQLQDARHCRKLAWHASRKATLEEVWMLVKALRSSGNHPLDKGMYDLLDLCNPLQRKTNE